MTRALLALLLLATPLRAEEAAPPAFSLALYARAAGPSILAAAPIFGPAPRAPCGASRAPVAPCGGAIAARASFDYLQPAATARLAAALAPIDFGQTGLVGLGMRVTGIGAVSSRDDAARAAEASR